MLTFTELLAGVFGIGALALVGGGFQAGGNEQWRHLGGPFTMALVGVGFMLSVGVVALAELSDLEQLPPTRALRLWVEREEPAPGT
ncbi:hypothetical protein [Streptosporangium sp. NPDC023615]|uniref:hypothetical protein n=1 Tax=Streptosporangium sp. NPDC023615 TaxID=3154794 RepID=UPI00343A2A11